MAFQNNFNGFVQEICRFNEETSAFINDTLETLQTMVDHKLNQVIAEAKPSTTSDGSESNGTHERAVSASNRRREPRVALKRSSNEPDDNDSPIKKPRMSDEPVDDDVSETSNEHVDDDASGTSDEGGHDKSFSSLEATETVDDEMNGRRSVMNVKANMGKNGTLEYLNQWLTQVYDQTAKFYSIKKYSRMGTFIFYAAIDVNLDEAKDDVHVVVNSDHLHRPDVIFRFIDDCFQDRKVVTLLHIVTNDELHLREDPARLEQFIRTMVEPIVVHL